jgi:hypothetical protein
MSQTNPGAGTIQFNMHGGGFVGRNEQLLLQQHPSSLGCCIFTEISARLNLSIFDDLLEGGQKRVVIQEVVVTPPGPWYLPRNMTSEKNVELFWTLEEQVRKKITNGVVDGEVNTSECTLARKESATTEIVEWSKDEMARNIQLRMTEMGGPKALPLILHRLEEKTKLCSYCQTCPCGKLLECGIELLQKWFKNGQPTDVPANGSTYPFTYSDGDNHNWLRHWNDWNIKHRCSLPSCRLCDRIGKDFTMEAMLLDESSPINTLVRIRKIADLEKRRNQLIDEWDGTLKDSAQTENKKRSRSDS